MTFQVWCGSASGRPDFEYTHEEMAAAKAIEQLEAVYGRSEEFCYLALNFHCEGKDLDALILKHDAIIVVDFKDCNSPIRGGVNGLWEAGDEKTNVLNAGRYNPFQQVRDYRFGVMKHLNAHRDGFLPAQKAPQARFEHVSGMVCVSPDLHPDSCIEIDLGQHRWFHVVGLPTLVERLQQIRSPQISLTETEAQLYLETVLRCIEYRQPGTPEPEVPVETTHYQLSFRFESAVVAEASEQGINFENDLDSDQLAAVRHPASKLLVLAGAGTGKTRALIYRAASILQQGHRPEQLLVTTFTNKAADELHQRLAEMIGPSVSRAWIGTFHSICHRILRRHAHLLGYSERFAILDESDCKEVLKRCFPNRPYIDPEQFVQALSYSRNLMQPLSEVVLSSGRFVIRASGDVCERVARCYLRKLKRADCMDFDDLLVNTVKLFEDNLQVLNEYQRRFTHVLVDEYQDTNRLQGYILKHLGQTCGVTVVGDDSQAIYGFRGACLENILEFERDFPGAEACKLELNHRSTPEILALANENIRHNRLRRPKTLRPADGRAEHIKPWFCLSKDEDEEVSFVVSRVLDLYGRGFNLREISILFRAQWVSARIQAALNVAQVPFEVFGATRFFNQEHIKDVLAFLRVTENADDSISLYRLWRINGTLDEALFRKLEDQAEQNDTGVVALAHEYVTQPVTGLELLQTQRLGLFLKQLEVLSERNQHVDSLPALIDYVVNECYLPHLKRLQPGKWADLLRDLEALRGLSEHYRTIPTLLEAIALDHIEVSGKHQSRHYAPEDMLALSTVHAAKGREWRAVFVIGLREDVFPNPKAIDAENSDEEERRLFHVAVTRAREQLYLTAPKVVDSRRGARTVPTSRFITEMTPSVYKYVRISD